MTIKIEKNAINNSWLYCLDDVVVVLLMTSTVYV